MFHMFFLNCEEFCCQFSHLSKTSNFRDAIGNPVPSSSLLAGLLQSPMHRLKVQAQQQPGKILGGFVKSEEGPVCMYRQATSAGG